MTTAEPDYNLHYEYWEEYVIVKTIIIIKLIKRRKEGVRNECSPEVKRRWDIPKVLVNVQHFGRLTPGIEGWLRGHWQTQHLPPPPVSIPAPRLPPTPTPFIIYFIFFLFLSAHHHLWNVAQPRAFTTVLWWRWSTTKVEKLKWVKVKLFS